MVGVEEFHKDIVKGVHRTRLLKKIRSIPGKAIFRECSLSFSKGASHTLTISVFTFAPRPPSFGTGSSAHTCRGKPVQSGKSFEHGSCVFSDNCRAISGGTI